MENNQKYLRGKNPSTTMEVINATGFLLCAICCMSDSIMTSQHPPPLIRQQPFCGLYIINSVPESSMLVVF